VPVDSSLIRNANRRLIVYAANRYGTVSFDSDKENFDVAPTVRFSMSIPFYFTTRHGGSGYEMYDGGILNNYPVEVFLRDRQDDDEEDEPWDDPVMPEFVALYLYDGDQPKRQPWLRIVRIATILLNRDEYSRVRRYPECTVKIDCSPIGTVDFGLTTEDKELLLNRGRLAALQFVIKEGWDVSGTAALQRERVEGRIERLIEPIAKRYERSRDWKRLLWTLVAIGALVIVWWNLVAGYTIVAALTKWLWSKVMGLLG